MTITTTTIGTSVQSRNIDVTVFTPSTTVSQFKIYVQGRQHGDEQESEAACNRLITSLTGNSSLYDGVTIAVVPLCNPDGKNANTRFQSESKDMNRDHLLLATKEVKLLRSYINTFKPDVLIDMHNFPANADFLDVINKKFAEDVELDKCNNPACKQLLTETQFADLLTFIKTENPTYIYNQYLQASDVGTMRHSTEDVIDARNGDAFRHGCFGFICEGREPRSDEVAATQEEQTTAGQHHLLLSFIEWWKDHSYLIKPITNPPTNQTINLEVSQDAGTNFTAKLIDKTTLVIADNVFTNVHQTLHVSDTNIAPSYGYAVPTSLTALITNLTNHGISGVTGTSKDRYQIETYHFGSSLSNPASAGALVTQSTKKGFTGYTLYNTHLNAADGNFLSYYLEPYSEYGANRYNTELSLGLAINTDYPILRLLKSAPVWERKFIQKFFPLDR